MNEIRLENWAIAAVTESVYHAPETGYAGLTGNVYGHPRFKDGTLITTSPIIKADPKAGWAETHNTLYRLGKINPVFKKYLKQNKYRLDDYAFWNEGEND